MKLSTTIILLVTAAALMIFVMIYEPFEQRKEAAIANGRLFNFDPVSVSGIHIVNGDETVEIKRRGEDWIMDGPHLHDRVADGEVNKVIQAALGLSYLDRIRASEIKSDAQLDEYGVRRPKQTLDFQGDIAHPLIFGKEATGDNRIYVRFDGSKEVFVVPDSLQQLLFRDPAEFRDRRLTDLRPDMVGKIVIRRGDGEIELDHDYRGWTIMKPLQAPADSASVEKFLSSLLGLKILKFLNADKSDLGALGLQDGTNEISLYTEDKSSGPQTLRIGSPVPGEQDGRVYAQFTPRSLVCELPSTLAGLGSVSPDSLRDRHLLPVNLDLIDVIRIATPSHSFSLARSGENWVVQSDGKSVPASEGSVRKLADALGQVEVKKFQPAVDADFTAAGLNPPAITVSFDSVLSENTPETTAGERVVAKIAFGAVKDGQVAVHVGDRPEICNVAGSVLDVIPAESQAWAAPEGR